MIDYRKGSVHGGKMAKTLIFCFWLLTSVFNLAEELKGNCPDNWINCGIEDRCVAPEWQCDGNDDCGNMRDEMDCDNIDIEICEKDQFHCENKKMCIPMAWKCNNYRDCNDGSDEINCGNDTAHCEFPCLNGNCVPLRWHCDGMDDCGDRTDELNCSNINCPDYDGHYLCTDGYCVSPQDVCDGKNDCPDGGDEGEHCKSPSCANIRCAYKCVSIDNVPHCYCPTGFELSKLDNKSCVDVDECKIEGYCSQMCKNTNGSVECSCVDGYELHNNTFCQAQDQEPLLIFTGVSEIRAMWLRSKRYFPVGEHNAAGFGLDYDVVSNRVFWSNASTPTFVKSADLEFSDVKDVVTTGLELVMDLEVDWLGRNLYITDDYLRSIVVCKLEGSFCSVINTNVDQPRSLALDPPSGIMYWTNWGNEAGIHKQGMDGSDNILFVANLTHPNIALDTILNKLYWADEKENAIESINLDGTGRKLILKENLFSPYAITVFEDQLYWTDFNMISINTCNKFTGRNVSALIKTPIRFGGIHVYHPVLHKFEKNPCWASHCSHLCLLAPRGKYTCACPAGLHLSLDNETCLLNRMAPRIYILDPEGLFVMYPDSIGNQLPVKVPIPIKFHSVTYDWDNGILYLADTLETIWATNSSSYVTKKMVSGEIGWIHALCYDHIGENLYWSDIVDSKIEVASLDGTRKVLVKVTAVDLVLFPEKGVMFAVIASTTNHIAMYDMDGKNYREIKGTNPALSISFNRFTETLYWLDVKRNKIFQYIGTEINSHLKRNPHLTIYIRIRQRISNSPSSLVLQKDVGTIASIAVIKNNVYWTELNSHHIFSRLLTNEKFKSIPLPTNEDKGHSAVRRIVYIHPVVGEKICRNSGCKQLCLLTPKGHVCACSTGYVLGDDKRNCIVKRVSCQPTEFTCENGECVSKEKRCNRWSDCKDHSDEQNCEYTCPSTDFQCANGRCIPLIWKCDGTDDCKDNSDERNCTTTAVPSNVTSVSTCRSDKFACDDGQCIDITWVCDTQNECNAGEDEANCDKWQCPHGYKQCRNKQCIYDTWWCDQDFDCQDKSDELNCTTEKCEGYLCRSGKCIDEVFVCDSIQDCPDSDDEENCQVSSCPPNQMQCMDGRCIPYHYICDNVLDCKGGEDEKDCNTTRKCANLEFKCHSGQCIAKNLVCDGYPDCFDKSDEYNCQQTTTVATCSTEEYRCNSGQCIPKVKTCDGEVDCLDESDESSYCNIHCLKDNGGCSQKCESTPFGPTCSCHAGFQLIDKVTCVDIDECQVDGRCSHYCHNTKGGFICTCEKGYALTSSRQTCKAEGDLALLLRTVEDEIRISDFHLLYENLVTKEIGKQSNIIGLDFDAKSHSILWLEGFSGSIKSYSSASNVTTTIIKGLQNSSAMAYDWITSNYYVSHRGGILVCGNSNKQIVCSTIVSGKVNIPSIALAAQEGLMFWSSVEHSVPDMETKNEGMIKRSEMDGNDTIILLENDLIYPISLTIDHVLRTLYWFEPTTNRIKSIGFDGENRKVLLHDGFCHPTSLSLFEDYLFCSDWKTASIKVCDKFTGRIYERMEINDSPRSFLKIVHSVLQPTIPNPCLTKNCSHLCLLTRNGATCKCPDSYVSTVNGCRAGSFGLCTSDYCYNDGKCALVNSNRKCSCIDGYLGERCDVLASQSRINDGAIAGVVIAILLFITILAVYLYWRRSRNGIGEKNTIMSFLDILKRTDDKENLVTNMEENVEESVPRQRNTCENITNSFRLNYKYPERNMKSESLDIDSRPNERY